MWLRSIVNNNLVGSPPIVGRQLCDGGASAGIIAAGISALGSVGSSALSGVSASNLNGRNRRWQERMFQKQVDETWRQIHYNDVQNQVDRYKEAGINPALAYGNMQSGSISSDVPNAGASPYQHAPDYSIGAQGLANAASQYFAFRNMEQDIKTKEINNSTLQERNRAEINKIVESMKGIKLDNDSKEVANQIQKDTAKFMVENADLQNKALQANISLTQAQTAKTDVDRQLAQYDLDFLKPQQLALIKNQIAVGVAQIRELKSRAALNNMTAKQVEANIGLIAQQTTKAMYEVAGADWDQQQKGLLYKITKDTMDGEIKAKNMANARETKQNMSYADDGWQGAVWRFGDNLLGTAGKVFSGSFKVK